MSDCKHDSKSSHLNNYKCLKAFSLYDIVTAISESSKLEKDWDNKLVEEKKNYLKQ